MRHCGSRTHARRVLQPAREHTGARAEHGRLIAEAGDDVRRQAGERSFHHCWTRRAAPRPPSPDRTIAAAAATRAAATFRAVAASSPPMPQAFNAAADAAGRVPEQTTRPSAARRRMRRCDAASVERADEGVGRQRCPAGERVLPGRGMVEQVEQRSRPS